MTLQIEIENRNLPPHIQMALKLPKEKREAIIRKGIWVQYPLANEMIAFLDDLDRQPRRPRMMGRTLVGPTGNGKTSIIQEFIAAMKERRNLGKNSYEYAYVRTPPEPTIKQLLIRMLTACNFDVGKGTAEILWQKAVKGYRDLGVRMLFIDDIQDLLNSQNQRILNVCRALLKDISDTLMIPIILIGTEKAESVLKGDKQVLSRYPVIHLNRWPNRKHFRLLLDSFEKGLPLHKASNLKQKSIADRIYELSEGIIGNVATIITDCGIEAVRSGKEKITLSIIEKLHEGIFSRF